MTINIAPAIKEGLEYYRTQPPLTGAEWADKNFYLSAESSGIEGRWVTFPYQIGPLNWMCDDDIEEFNWQKSARVGYTKLLLAATGYGIEHKKRNIVIWQPTDGDAKDFTGDEIDTMLRDVPVVGDLLRCPVDSKSKYNTVEKKVFLGATLDIKGGKSGRNYRRMTKDIAVYDETDGFDTDIDGEGSPFELGDTRTQTSSFPKSIRGSTPRIKNVSLIEAAVNACGDWVFYRFLPCPQCGGMQYLEFAQLRVKDDEAGQYICKHNGCVITYSDYPEMDKGGRWQTLHGYYYRDDTDLFYDPNDEIIPRPKRIAAVIWSAYSYFTTWTDTAEKWVEARKESKNGNHSKLKTVINTRLGETWEEKGESIEATGFMARLENYTPECLPTGVIVITAGVDVQGGKDSRIECEIVGHGLEGETWSIDYFAIKGDPEQQDVWNHLDEQLLKHFFREDGVELHIAATFVDSGYLATQVYKFTGPRKSRNVFATKGVNDGLLCNQGSWKGDKKNGSRAILHTINVDDAKTILFKRLQKENHGPGYCHFPAHYTQEYFDGLTNEEKKEKRKAGRLVGYEWKKKHDHKANEPIDCRNYATGALERLNPNMAQRKLVLDAQAARIKSGLSATNPRQGRRMRTKRS